MTRVRYKLKYIKIFTFSFLTFLLLNCSKNNRIIAEDDIIKIQLNNFNSKFFLTENKYELNDDYKKPGIHNLKFTKKDLEQIRSKIIDEKIPYLKDSLEYIKSCEKICWVEIIIEYKNNKIQRFKFDNSNYKSNFKFNKSYKKISELETLISKLIMDKRLEMDAKIELM